MNGHINVVDYLVRHGANVNGDWNNYWFWIHDKPPLSLAAENGHVDVVDYLVRQGAKVNENGSLGKEMLLSLAARKGHVNLAFFLVCQDDRLHCPRGTAIQSRERHKIGLYLLARLSKLRQRLIDESDSHSASVDFALFGEQLGTRASIWKDGTRVMRNLTNGHLPSELPDIISCLLVADAMRSATSDATLVCSKQE
jgi:hypothetical protein